jgi:predicted amidohydrolase
MLVRDAEGQMTANRNLKRRVRARAAKTGESYTTALRHFRPSGPNGPGATMPETKHLRLAVAATNPTPDPTDPAALRATAADLRDRMREAHRAGARIVHFMESATGVPHKYGMSSLGPDRLGPADWTTIDWPVLCEELTAIAALAGELGIWTVLGSVHRLTPPHRPHNSLYVINDKGELATRYDERMLSNTKVSYLYSPGSAPAMFEVDGVRFGLLLGMEVHFPELFDEYEKLGVDCVLFSSTGGTDAFATEGRAQASINNYWVSIALPDESGIVSPDGAWLTRATTGVGIADLDESTAEVAVFKARPWRRTARAGLYDPYQVTDPRSDNRAIF